MQVLAIASEIYPLVKTGGLADVTGALPLALKARGISTKTLIPGYPAVMAAVGNTMLRAEFDDLLGARASVLEADYKGLTLLILDAPELFDRAGGPYLDTNGLDYPDNWRRFAALSKAGAEIATGALPGWQPDLVHVHDWQAAMTPVYMRYGFAPELPSALTIHNIAFQGQFAPEIFGQLDLPPHAFSIEGVEYYGDVGFLKGGLQTSHAITTVSPSYAEEILTPDFGMGLEGVIAARADFLHGIVNGIDTQIWNPETDPMIAAGYSASGLAKRTANRKAIVSHFGLVEDDGPIFCVVSRLTWQKGMDLVADAADEIVAQGGKLAILGSGDPDLERSLLAATHRHPGRIGMTIGYNEALSHQMQAGADAILIPSRFEPCGLTQLYGLRYGCVPIVGRTGGLADTVIDANEAAINNHAATGIQFSPIDAAGLRQALRRAFRLYYDQKLWTQLQKQGMKSEVSWEKSAERYAALYSSLVAKGI